MGRFRWYFYAMRSHTVPPRLHRLVALFALLLAVLGACSSGDSNETATDDSTDTTLPDADSGSGSDDDSGPAVPVLNAVRVAEIGQSLVGDGITPAHVNCVIERSEGDTQLTAVLAGLGGPGFELSPEGYTALAVGFHGCVEPEILTTALSGLAGGADDAEVAAFDSCMTDRIAQELDGDLAYTGVSALLVGFPVPEGAQEATLDALTGCVGARTVATQLAARAEQEQAYAIEVDVDCAEELLDETVLEQYWQTAVTGEGEALELGDQLESCTTEFESDLSDEIPASFVPFSGNGELAGVVPTLRNGLYTEAPPMSLADGVDYSARLTTVDGVIDIDLFEETAPVTVNNFVSLARDGFYDATIFHRVLEGFMAQAGDPTGSGTGGPGYTFADEATGMADVDRRGLLAMANSGPDTNGSQFFITFAPATHLTGLHTVFGEVTNGDDILGAVDLRDPANPTGRGEQIISLEIIEG